MGKHSKCVGTFPTDTQSDKSGKRESLLEINKRIISFLLGNP